MDWLSDGWAWFTAHTNVVVAVCTVLTMLGGIFVYLVSRGAPSRETIGNDRLTERAVEVLREQLAEKDRALAEAHDERRSAQDRAASMEAQLREAVTAISKQTDIPDAQARIHEALEAAADGRTELAEAIFAEVEARKTAEGADAYQAAAQAARHRGALAFLHDTDKALDAYRKATELDPENADGWNRLGHLLTPSRRSAGSRTAYRRVARSGEKANDRMVVAVAYGNLGNVYQVGGDLDQAEAMYRKSLEIEETLGRKEGMAKPTTGTSASSTRYGGIWSRQRRCTGKAWRSTRPLGVRRAWQATTAT
ncbi:MAG: tetratricopeptide repeat protein [Rhodovibrio sp.]|nr:tetratricopeptide repeat protein [Rhodovibrio sp.]